MQQRKKFIILGFGGFILLVVWFAVLSLIIKTMSGSSEDVGAPQTEVVLCDEDASGLCIVTFGANNINRMVINFQLPDPDYSPFYVKVNHRETVGVYACEVVESVQTSVYCTGVRTPLGETIEIEVYAIADDKLIARGTFLVSAIAIATPVNLPGNAFSVEEVPTSEPVPGDDDPLNQIDPVPLPETAYPNP